MIINSVFVCIISLFTFCYKAFEVCEIISIHFVRVRIHTSCLCCSKECAIYFRNRKLYIKQCLSFAQKILLLVSSDALFE
uniref:Secreted protein n=1 Tax=Pinctada fucata TaxID=50426 RepID=A0A194ALR9_PINFU